MNTRLLKILIYFVFIVSQSYAENEIFDHTIENLIYEKIGNNQVVIDLNYDSKDRLDRVKIRSNDIKNISLTNLDTKYSVFRVRIDYSNGASDELSGRYNSYLMVPVPSRFIKAGEIILTSDIVKAKTKINKIKDNYVTLEQDIVGMQAKKHLSPGMIVKNEELSKPIVIKIGDPVNIVYLANNIKLKTSGIALGGGAIGDNIRVKNEDSGATVLGQIISKNTIQVSGE